jgi:uncharacterized protein YjiS (DUF1127 family)
LSYSQLKLIKALLKPQILIGDIMTSYTQNCPQHTISDSSGRLYRLLDWCSHTIKRQALKQTIAKERAQLKRLSPEMLKDIGIDQVKAIQEAKRIDIPASRIL